MSLRPPDWERRLRDLERRADNRGTDIVRLWGRLPQAPELPGYAMPRTLPSSTTTPAPGGIVVPSGFNGDSFWCDRWNMTFPIIFQHDPVIEAGGYFGLGYRTALNSYGVGWYVSFYGRFYDVGQTSSHVSVWCTNIGNVRGGDPDTRGHTISYLYSTIPFPSGYSYDYDGLMDYMTGREFTLTQWAHTEANCTPGEIYIVLNNPNFLGL